MAICTCLSCGRRSRDDPSGFRVDEVLVATPLSDAMQTQAPAIEMCRLTCACGWSMLGRLDGEQFLGDLTTQRWAT